MNVIDDDDTGKTRVEFWFEDTPDLKITLVYDFNKIAEAEAVCGFSLLQPVFTPSQMTAGQLRGLLYALASTSYPSNDPQTALEHAGDLITKDVFEVFRAVAACLGVAVARPGAPALTGNGNAADDEALFAALASMAVLRPLRLVEMLAELKVPSVEAETVEAVSTDQAPAQVPQTTTE